MKIIVDILIRSIQGNDPLAEWLLGIIGNEYIVDSMIAALKNGDRVYRCGAARVLGRIGNPRAVKPLIAAMKLDCVHRNQRKNKTNQSAVEMRKLNVSKNQPLEFEVFSAVVAKALGLIGDTRAMDALIPALMDKERNVRAEAGIALKKISPLWNKQTETREHVRDFIHALQNEDYRIRAAAARGLGFIGDELVVAPLLSAMEDKKTWVRKAAAIALGRIKDQHSSKPLVAVMENDNQLVYEAEARVLHDILYDKSLTHCYADLYCKTCLRATRLKIHQSLALVNRDIILCPSCCNTKNLLPEIKRITGMIGGNVVEMTIEKDEVKIPLWNERSKKAWYADIDRLYISAGGVENYHRAVNAVILEFTSGPWSGKPLNSIPVQLEGSLNLSRDVINMLRDNFSDEKRLTNNLPG